MSEKPDEQSETEDPSEDKFEKVSDLFGHSNNQPSTEDKIEWYLHQSFWTGIIGWFVGNGLIWLFITNANTWSGMAEIVMALLIIPINIFAMLFYSKREGMITMGLLTAFSINFVLVIMQGMFIKGVCFTPFFIQGQF